MEAKVSQHYDRTVDEMFALVTDPGFLERRAHAAGEKNVAVHVDRDGGKLVIRIERDVDRSLPGFMKKVFKPTNHIIDVQTWSTDGPVKISDWTVEIVGQSRVKLRGRMTLAAGAGGGCDYTEAFSAEVSMPLIGKQVAKYVVGETEKSIRGQLEFTTRDLAAGPG